MSLLDLLGGSTDPVSYGGGDSGEEVEESALPRTKTGHACYIQPKVPRMIEFWLDKENHI